MSFAVLEFIVLRDDEFFFVLILRSLAIFHH
ncbi:hypothetical protein Lacidipiscis_00651 [Ligilactobacillus acidipiscis]|jgi:hypothetical protein|nr:hypothetical protein Lacidipiscis_00651 [Ligilactobacillus acidipiscis]